ncbi:SAYSvFN domain-containing protein 1 [Biomphalaria glabrata]|nr:SAYSvFN domain-containing protein 1-like [Biomphalaria glabrata]
MGNASHLMFINMEARLAEYRATKAKAKQSEQSPLQLFKLFVLKFFKPKKTQQDEQIKENILNEKDVIITHRKNFSQSTIAKEETNSDTIDGTAISQLKQNRTTLDWIILASKFLLWLVLWALFIELQFGAVFFTISLIIFIYFNTRTGPKDNKLSAYSVFNKECERLHGTLTAEQLQRNMFSVPGLPG